MYVKCYLCGQQVEGDLFGVHMWNYHNRDIRHLIKRKRSNFPLIGKYIPKRVKKEEKWKDYDKYFKTINAPKSKGGFFRGLVFGALLTTAFVFIYLWFL